MTALLLALVPCLPVPPAQERALDTPPLVHRRFESGVMGTSLVIETYGEDGDAMDAAIAEAFAELQRVEDLMTDWRPSPLMELNAAAGQGPHEVDAEIFDVLTLAVEVGSLSDGAFDVTFAAAGKLWDFKAKPPRLPSDAELAEALTHVDYRRLVLDPDARTVTLPAGSRIGLGGIAKGYGVDRAMAVLLRHGIHHAVVNAGGDLKVLGKEEGRKPWEIAIRHPRDRERAIAVVPVSNTCVVSSGDYERFFELDGKRYHHILDPRTGRSATGAMSATVITPDAALADALATAMCVLGPQKGIALLESLPRTEGVLVDLEGEVHLTRGLAQRLGR